VYKGRNVVIAGGTGPIGIPLTKQLIERGANVTVVSLENHDYASKVLHPKAKFVQSDLVDIQNCNNIVKNQDMVFNLMGIRGSVGIGKSLVKSLLNHHCDVIFFGRTEKNVDQTINDLTKDVNNSNTKGYIQLYN